MLSQTLQFPADADARRESAHWHCTTFKPEWHPRVHTENDGILTNLQLQSHAPVDIINIFLESLTRPLSREQRSAIFQYHDLVDNTLAKKSQKAFQNHEVLRQLLELLDIIFFMGSLKNLTAVEFHTRPKRALGVTLTMSGKKLIRSQKAILTRSRLFHKGFNSYTT